MAIFQIQTNSRLPIFRLQLFCRLCRQPFLSDFVICLSVSSAVCSSVFLADLIVLIRYLFAVFGFIRLKAGKHRVDWQAVNKARFPSASVCNLRLCSIHRGRQRRYRLKSLINACFDFRHGNRVIDVAPCTPVADVDFDSCPAAFEPHLRTAPNFIVGK